MSVAFVDCSVSQFDGLQSFFRSTYRESYRLAWDASLLRWQFGGRDGKCHVKLAVAEDQIQACLGFIPVEFHVAGQTVRAAWTANWMVAPSHRRLGLGPLLLRQLTEQFDIVLSLGLEADACELLPRMGWRDFGDLARYVCVLDETSASLLTETGQLQWPSPPSTPIAPAQPVGVVEVPLDEGIDDLWSRAWGRQAGGTRRSLDFLRWRYLEHPSFHYRILRLRSITGGSEALAVFRMEPVRDAPVTVCRITELVADVPLAANIIRAVVHEARDAGAAMVDFSCSSRRLEQPLISEGFLPAEVEPASQLPMLFQPVNRSRRGIRFMAHLRKVPQAAALTEWYVTRGDGDQDRPN
jgi:hypothetical protein